MTAKSLLVALVCAAMVLSATPVRAAQQDDDQIQLSAAEVMVDLIVTDDKGRPITDLRADEVEIYEDGKRQEITSFGLVQTGSETNQVAGTTPGVRPPLAIEMSPFRGFNYIIVVVDRTSLNQQDLEQTFKASEKFLAEQLQPNDLVSVFVAGSRLLMVQNFTNNKERLTTAMRNATDPSVSLPTISESDRLAREVSISGVPIDQASTTPDPGAGGSGAAGAIADLNNLAERVNSSFDSLVGQFQSFAVVQDLLALMQLYNRVPGRKSVVFFSEGLAVDSAVESAFSSLINTANRNNFAFYTVDAAGLRTDAAGNRPIFSAAPAPGARRVERDRSLVDATGNSGLGRAERSVRTAGNSALHRLAVDTGGVPLRNSNDLNRGFQSVADDLQSYYALAYAPTNPAIDGKFRSIEVKVTRKDADVRARKGYYATPEGNGGLLLPFEQPVIAMLYEAQNGAEKDALPVMVKVERFRTENGWALPIVMHMNASQLEAAKIEGKREKDTPFEFEVDAVAVVRDASGRIVAKTSRSYLYKATEAELDRFKQLELTNTFSQPLVVPPGTYKIAVGIYDPNAEKGTVVERAVLAPEVKPGAEMMSSIVLSRDILPVPADERAKAAGDPLVFEGTTRIIPNVTGRFVKSTNDPLVVYFRFYGAPNKRYQAQVKFLKGGQLVNASQPTDLPMTNASGETGFAPTIPTTGLEPGTYMVQVFVIDPETQKPVASSTANFRIDA